jgi:hypothetical protein
VCGTRHGPSPHPLARKSSDENDIWIETLLLPPISNACVISSPGIGESQKETGSCALVLDEKALPCRTCAAACPRKIELVGNDS